MAQEMVVTDSGIVTVASDEHPSKALAPMTVTDSGIITDVSELH
jgi:hypothetical protein